MASLICCWRRALVPCALFAFSVLTHPGVGAGALAHKPAHPYDPRGCVGARGGDARALLGLTTRAAEQASVGLLVVGAATIVSRRPTIFHLLGLLMAENGIALAALSVRGGCRW